MNKFWILFLPILLLNCSFDTKSGFWTQEKKITNVNKNIQELFKEEKKFNKEFIFYEVLFNGTVQNFINIMKNKKYNINTQKKVWIIE